MDDAPDSRELAKRFDLLKKDFEIMQANVNSTLNEMRTEMAQRDAARSERERDRAMVADGHPDRRARDRPHRLRLPDGPALTVGRAPDRPFPRRAGRPGSGGN